MSDANPSTLLEQLQQSMPLGFEALSVTDRRCGLLIIDEVNGFATTGAGNLAPPVDNPQVTGMVAETDRLATAFLARGLPVFATLDCHEPGKAEPPYPPHCEQGTGEEMLVPELKWLEAEAGATLMNKDCINGFIGAFGPDGSNAVVNWIRDNKVEDLVVVGICTDICVMDFVLTLLSARNHGMVAPLEEIYVHEKGCSTFDLPRDVAESLGYGATASHPQEATHYLGMYFMASRGARLVNSVDIQTG
jgi:nicotinamidase-related amidase